MSREPAGLGGGSRWKDRWFAKRNALLANPRFQRWAATFPPFRRVAARRAAGLFDLCAGFVYSQVLFACVELGLFETLAAGPATTEALAASLDLAPERLAALLTAAGALGLTEARGGRHGLGMHGAAFLGNPGVGAMVAHHAMLYRDLADPVALLRGDRDHTELARFWPYAAAGAPATLGEEAVAPYGTLMSASLSLLADDVLDAFPLDEHAELLDVGGGAGDFLLAAARRQQDLRLTLFDLPAVARRAETRFAQDGLAGRARVVGGDYKRDALPPGADAISLVRVAHDLDDADLDALLGRIRAALPSGGALLLAEPMADTPGAERVGAYFAMYLAAMGSGRPRSAADLSARLRAAGFASVHAVPTRRPMLASLLVARTGIRGPTVSHS